MEEHNFDFEEVPDKRKVKVIEPRLKRHASAWWEQLKVHRERMGKPKIVTWEKIKKELQRNSCLRIISKMRLCVYII